VSAGQPVGANARDERGSVLEKLHRAVGEVFLSTISFTVTDSVGCPKTKRRITMETWSFQVRIHLADNIAGLARQDPTNPMLESLTTVLARHNASMKCQLDAFMDYVIEAETQGIEHYPLYQWTKETIDDPAKSKKHLGVFTLYVDGEEVYPKKVADALEYDLSSSVDPTLIKRISKYDTNPANNPQPPVG